MNPATMNHDEIDPRTHERLARGEVVISTEVVQGSPLPRVRVLAVIEAPPARVWQVIDRVADYRRTMGGVKQSTEISREPVEGGAGGTGTCVRSGGASLECGAERAKCERVRARITVKLPFPLQDLTSVTEAVHTVDPDRRYERRWQLVEGDYHENQGGWVLEPFAADDRRTLVRYTLHAVPTIRIPAALQGMAQKKVIPRLIEHLRRQV